MEPEQTTTRRAHVSPDCIARDDEDSDLAAVDFGFATDKTVAEQRVSSVTGAGAPAQSNSFFGSLTGFGKSTTKASSDKRRDGAKAVAGRASASKAGASKGDTAPPVSDNASVTSTGTTGTASRLSSVTGAAMGGASLVAGASVAVGRGAGAALTGGLAALSRGTGTAAGESGAEIALGLVNACVELMSLTVTALDFENAQAELAIHIDAVVGSSNLNGLGAALLDYWFAVQSDTLSTWPLFAQHNWVRSAYVVKYGDLRASPGALAQTTCNLLLELGQGFRPGVLIWDQAQSDSWMGGLHHLRNLAESSSPPNGWCFPSFTLVRECESAFNAPTFFVARADQKGTKKVKAKELVAQLKSGGRVLTPRPTALPSSSGEEPSTFLAKWEALASQAGGSSLVQKCAQKSDRHFNQKTKPIQFRNNASSALKICLFAKDDKICAVPVGGLKGTCVVTLDANQRVQLRPPGTADQFLLKVLTPGIIEKPLYYADVWRGTTIQLRSHDCGAER